MYCRQCGKELNEDARFCPACGAKVYQETDSNSYGSTYSDPFTTATATEIEDKPAKCWSVFALVGKILGIIAIVICWLPLYGAMAGVPGIVFSCLGRKAIDDNAIRNRTIGLKLAIAGTVISVVLYIILACIVGGSALRELFEVLENYM